MTIGELDGRMSPKEYRAWRRYFTKWRFPGEAVDVSLASIGHMFANMLRGATQAPFKLAEFRADRRFGYEDPDAPKPTSEADKYRRMFRGG